MARDVRRMSVADFGTVMLDAMVQGKREAIHGVTRHLYPADLIEILGIENYAPEHAEALMTAYRIGKFHEAAGRH